MQNISKKFTFPLFETIRLQNGKIMHLKYHVLRMKRSYEQLFGQTVPFDLIKILKEAQLPGKGLYKIRFLYGKKDYEMEISTYKPKRIKKLKLIEDNEIDYSLKFTDRSRINYLLSQKGNADDILIVQNGEIKEISFANVAFFDGQNWLTPEKPLLKGTALMRYLENGVIKPAKIMLEDLNKFNCMRYFNAMIDFEKQPCLPVERICD